MGGNKKRKTEKKAFTFGGNISTDDDTGKIEPKDSSTEWTSISDSVPSQTYQASTPVINTPKEPEPTIQFKAPEPEPSKLSKNTGITISSDDNSITHRDKFPENTGATISTYSGGEKGPKLTSNVYEDPKTGSTIATKEARENIADGDFYNVVASTGKPKVYTPTAEERPDMGFTQTGVEAPIKTGDVLRSGPEFDDVGGAMANPYAEEQQRILTNTYNPRPSEDLATGEPLQYSSSTSTTAINPRINSAVRRALISLGKAGGQLRRYFVR